MPIKCNQRHVHLLSLDCTYRAAPNPKLASFDIILVPAEVSIALGGIVSHCYDLPALAVLVPDASFVIAVGAPLMPCINVFVQFVYGSLSDL